MKIELVEMNHLEQMLPNYLLVQMMYPEMTLEEYTQMLHEMLPNQYYQLVGQHEGENIALTGFWINTKLWSGKYIEIDHFIVHPNYRSSGVGAQMVKYLENKAKELNCKMLTLDAYTNNFKAHKFFYNQGFIPKGFHFLKEV